MIDTSKHIKDLTVAEFDDLMRTIIWSIYHELTDPDYDPDEGLEFRPEFVQEILEQRRRIESGEEQLIAVDDIRHGYDTASVAEELGVSVRRVQQLIDAGRLPAVMHAGRWVITREALESVRERPTGRPRRVDQSATE